MANSVPNQFSEKELFNQYVRDRRLNTKSNSDLLKAWLAFQKEKNQYAELYAFNHSPTQNLAKPNAVPSQKQSPMLNTAKPNAAPSPKQSPTPNLAMLNAVEKQRPTPNLAMLNYVPPQQVKPNMSMILNDADRIYVEEQKLKAIEKDARDATRAYPSTDNMSPEAKAKLDAYDKQKALVNQLKTEKSYANAVESKAGLERAALSAPDMSVDVEASKSVQKPGDVKLFNNRDNLMWFLNNGGQSGALDYSESPYFKYKYLTPQEEATLRYFYGAGDYKSFDAYDKAISRDLDKHFAEANLKSTITAFDKMGVGGRAASAALAVTSDFATPAAYIENVGQVIKNALTGELEPTNPYSAAQNVVRQKEAFQDYTLQGASPVVRLLGQTGFDFADFATKLPYGPVGSLAYMSSSAAGQATYNALKRGATPDQAALEGTATGAIVYFTAKGLQGRAYKDTIKVSGGNVAFAEGAGNGRVLWSGGKNAMDVATDFATKNGLQTLELTATGKILTSCQNIANRIFGEEKAYQLLSPLWDKASARFVRGADGVIHAFLNSQGISDTSVFIRIEYEIAKERGLDLIFHLVK